MPRPLLNNSQKFRTQCWAEAVICNSELSEYAMDQLFADPKYVDSYGYNRRRLFNRAKKGYMPYRAADREAFIDRVAAHSRRLSFTKQLYNSLFWDLLDQPKFDLAKNRRFIIACIHQLKLVQSPSHKMELSRDTLVDRFILNSKSSLHVHSPLESYLEAFHLFSQAIPVSLDKVALMAGLYREVYYSGNLDFAFWSRMEYSTALVSYFTRHGCGSFLKTELFKQMDSIILFQDLQGGERYIKKIAELIHLQTPELQLNELLDYFLNLHEELLFNER